MSGGYFDYKQYTITQIADELEQIIRNNESTEINVWGDSVGRNYSEETLEKFKQGEALLRLAAIYLHRIDWLLECDDSEDSFHKRLEEDIKNREHS